MNETLTTHFKSKTISIMVDGLSNDIVISELIRINQPILSLTPAAHNLSTSLVAGKNCTLTEDNLSITTDVSGYPTVSQNKTGSATVVSIEINPLIDIAADKMLATLALYPQLPGTPPLTLEVILAICQEQEISCGIDELTIQESIEHVEQIGQPRLGISIARGLLPVDGDDAYLRFEIEIGPLPGKILQDGSIDWRERKIFIGIDKDELIATKVSLTLGTPGTDIHSNPISQKPGKDLKVKVSGDVQYNEESRQVLATCSGVLSIVNESDVKVTAKQTIDGDIDFAVGNIESKNGLEIKGNIKPGFTVSCNGDLSIGGNIYSATVRAKGNSKIASGLIGEQATLTTDGDVEISFAQQATIVSGGTVVITKGAYYANIHSKKMILCKPESIVVGGTFCSSLSFIGGIVGSDRATPITLVAGVEPERFRQRNALRANIRDLQQDQENLLQMNGQEYSETSKYIKKATALQKRINHFKKLNLIPNSPLYSKFDPTFNYCSATIAVQGKIASGTKIRIGNVSTTLEEEAAAIRFYIDRKTGDIVATPYLEGKK